MALKRWIGTTGDWGTAGNWTPSGVPANGDEVRFGSWSQVSVAGSSPAAKLMGKLIIEPTYTGDIGTSTVYLEITADATAGPYNRIIHRGSGTMYLDITGSPTNMVMDGPGSLYVAGNEALGAVCRTLGAKRGNVIINGTGVVSQYLILDGPGALVTLSQKAVAESSPYKTVVISGKLTIARDLTTQLTVIVMGGEVVVTGNVAADTEFIVSPYGRLFFERDTAWAADPYLVNAGFVTAAESAVELSFTNYIIGVQGDIQGTPTQRTLYGTVGIDLDLREDYP